MKSLTFSGDPTLKQSLLDNLKHHQDLDAFIQRTWIREEGDQFKGCFYGCTMQTSNNPIKAFSEKYNIDLWYCYLTEKIFEGLPDGEYQRFPYESIDVLPVDFDFNILKSSFNKAILLKQLDWVKDENIRKILVDTSKLFDVPFDQIDKEAAEAVAGSVSRAAGAAWSAAWSVLGASTWISPGSAVAAPRVAWAAARSAGSVESAEIASWSVDSVEWSAAGSASKANHYVWIRDTLFDLIRSTK